MSSARSPNRAPSWPARRRPQQTMQAANEQSAALARLLVIVENYPQLRSNETFNRLMDELAGTENRIAVERMRYNEQRTGLQHLAAPVSRRTSRPAFSDSANTRFSMRPRRPSACRL